MAAKKEKVVKEVHHIRRTPDSVILADLHEAVEKLLCKGLTCELLVQYREAVFLYKECLRYLKNLFYKVNELLDQHENPSAKLQDGVQFLRFLYDFMKDRTEALTEYKNSFAASMMNKSVADLNTVPLTIGSIHLDVTEPKRMSIISKMKKSKKAKSVKTKSIKSKDSSEVAENMNERKYATPNKKIPDIFDIHFGTFEFVTTGDLAEMFAINNVDIFNIDENSASLSEFESTIKFYKYSDTNVDIARNHIKYYLAVGPWLTPLVENVTPILWSGKIFILPDYSTFCLGTFKAMIVNNTRLVKPLRERLQKVSDFRVYSGIERRRDSNWDNGRSGMHENQKVVNMLETRPRLTAAVERTKANILGKLVSALNMLLPPKEFFVENGALVLVNEPCDKKIMVDEVFKTLLEDAFGYRRSIAEEMDSAMRYFQMWLSILVFKDTVSDYVYAERITFSTKGSGTSMLLANSARFAFRLNKKLSA